MHRHKYTLIFLSILLFSVPSIVKWAKPLLEERLPDEFRLDKIALDRNEGFPEFDLPDLSHLTGQVFTYLGHGEQAVAFASQDGCYVLKFFLEKQLHGPKKLVIPKPTHLIPTHREKKKKEKRAKAISIFNQGHEKLCNCF